MCSEKVLKDVRNYTPTYCNNGNNNNINYK